jgi:hypothetical protein
MALATETLDRARTRTDLAVTDRAFLFWLLHAGAAGLAGAMILVLWRPLNAAPARD